jgi:4-aminobutyrate aminotransferase-like enzyme
MDAPYTTIQELAAYEQKNKVSLGHFGPKAQKLPARLHFNCVRFLPPLTISDEMIDEGMAVLAQAFNELSE